ncbi:hypothetical protein PHLCEN_2v5587 [Hermanssonia centrifuga]|uniref:Uncharacterized protein n=1 Tax=Hermanssonia centrifuga TaxID=98765 RepID=A0A2R6P206_9APHY|nr:hypothetical protein PHLCEN_2v5587 [Hermanssonia centrifuga]
MVRDSRSPGRSYRSEYLDRDTRSRGSEDRWRERQHTQRDDRRQRDRKEDLDYDRVRGRGEGSRRSGHDDSRDRAPQRSDRDLDHRNARGGTSRRSASPQRRPSHTKSKSVSRSKSPEDKAKPNFAPSGLLAAATKTVDHADGTKTVLKYHEPAEARKPVVGWRLYVFKGKEQAGRYS